MPTLIFYTIAITTIEVLGKISPGGPCNPGLGVLVFMLLITVTGFLIVRNIILAINRGKKYWIIVGLHLLIITVFIQTNM